MTLPVVQLVGFDCDAEGICERTALRECVDSSHDWTLIEKDKASALLREILEYRYGEHALLLRHASRRVYQALVGPWCHITGMDGEAVYPELRWCDFPGNIVCYRAGLNSPLSTRQFERHREQLEELWNGPVLIETGARIGASPGAVVVRPAPTALTQAAVIPAAPQMPLALPVKIPLNSPKA